MPEQTIVCPKCGNRFPVSKALNDQIEAEAEKRGKEAEAVYEEKLAAETARLEKQARKQAEKAVSADVSMLREELAQAQKTGKDAQASFEHRLEEEISKLQKQARKAEDEAAERLEEKYHSRELESKKKLSDAMHQVENLERKLRRGSQQTQGEVIELELENVLKKAFPEDRIEPVAKGKPGADVLQKVHEPGGQYCGAILWESKNTQSWSKAWLGKLRNDQRRANAELAVLVSMALPKDVRHFAQVEGVWVARLPLALGLATALRTNLIEVAALRQSSKGKHEKLEVLNDYLHSTEFKHKIEAIVEAFRAMQEDLNKERKAMERQWAKREQQIQVVQQNVSGMYSDMQEKADQSLPKIRRLALLAANV